MAACSTQATRSARNRLRPTAYVAASSVLVARIQVAGAVQRAVATVLADRHLAHAIPAQRDTDPISERGGGFAHCGCTPSGGRGEGGAKAMDRARVRSSRQLAL